MLQNNISDITKQWEDQRAMYIPIKEKFDKLNTQINRYTNFTSLIEKNSVKLLEISRKRAY